MLHLAFRPVPYFFIALQIQKKTDMKLKNYSLYIGLYVLLLAVHFCIWELWVQDFGRVFMRYYLFLTFIFIFVLTILSLFHRIYPGYTGFTFMGLLLFKLAIMFLIMQKLELSAVPYYKAHFVFPYIFSLLLETLFAVRLLKDEKNQ